ncbi:MAG TPA: damage-control phosphatase ARMT1 family protein [Streptosporangiaceae bacterium]|nr:damage-control phosphatase ARMT1 family protein [Streptosporangiaceae bacterium]
MLTPPEDARPGWPPELLNNDPQGFAWGVWHDRTPKLVAQIRDARPYGPAQRRALDDLLTEISCGVIRPLGSHAHDQEAWSLWGAGYFGMPWLDVPFLWSESYFYRRLLDAVGFFEPGPWRWVDPFEDLKAAELADPGLEPDLAALDDLQRLPAGERGAATLLASLWGNRADLGFRIGRSPQAREQGSSMLVADDSADLRAALGADASVVIVADNAGRELLADLVLMDHLLQQGQASAVMLHVKPWPYYVSDATTADVLACLRRLARTSGGAAAIAHRVHTAMAEGRLGLYTHEFYCAPWCYRRMPADLASEFEQASLTIFKGDLNYRRLVGDRDWPPVTPFSDVASYFPCPVAVLRTLKSDVITGLSPATVADLDATGQSWRTDGSHGLLQVLLQPSALNAAGTADT